MWQFFASVMRRSSPLLLLVLVSACAQPEASKTGVASSPENSPEQVEPVPSNPVSPQPSPSTATSPQSQKASESTIDAVPTNPPQQKPVTGVATLPSKKRPGSITTPNRATFRSLVPTFQTTQRMAGFSADSNYYLYLESSRDSGAGIPKSSLQVVEMASNHCLETSCLETNYGESAAKLDLADAEQDLLQQTWKLRQDLGLTPPKAGTELAILSRSQTADGTETVTVRLNDRDQPLHLRLRQKQVLTKQGNGQDKAAMQLDVTYKGQHRSLDSLDNFRTWVLGYSIREVYLSPDGKRVAVLITAIKPTFEGTLATTLIQGFEL